VDSDRIIKLHTAEGIFYADYKHNRESFEHFAPHSHHTFSLSRIREGAIAIAYHSGEEVTLLPGQVALYHPDEVHKTRNLTDRPLVYDNLHIDTAWALGIQQRMYETDALLPMREHLITDPHIQEAFAHAVSVIWQGEYLQAEAAITQMLTRLFAEHTDPAVPREEDVLLEQIRRFILVHMDEKISATSIAAETGYSTAHISRLFKKRFGLTLQAFLIDQRINRAKSLMIESPELSLAEIAVEAGFYDQSHLVKNFKKAYSISPNHYKRS
jgi:AraC-like DNA-binding protein